MSELSTALGPIIHLFAQAVAGELRGELEKTTAEVVRLQRALEELKGSVDGDGKSVAQIPSSGTCWTCLWFGGKICLRAGSPNHNKRVEAIDRCELYKLTKIPRGEAIKKVGDPASRRATAVCPDCGHLVPTKKNGVLYQHDLDGHIYRGRGGDKERPCGEQQGKDHDGSCPAL